MGYSRKVVDKAKKAKKAARSKGKPVSYGPSDKSDRANVKAALSKYQKAA